MKCNDFYKSLQLIKLQAISELKAAIEAHGGKYYWCQKSEDKDEDTEDGCPIIAANPNSSDPNPFDIVVRGVEVINGYVVLDAEDKEWGEGVNIDINDVFVEHITFITEAIPKTEIVKSVNEDLSVNILFGKDKVSLHNPDRFKELIKSHASYSHVVCNFNTKAEKEAYLAGIGDGIGWNKYYQLDKNEFLNDPNINYKNEQD